MDLGDCVLRPASRAEAVGTRLEVRLEDGLEHQLQGGLHDPVCGCRNAQRADLVARLRDGLLPHRLRHEPAGLECLSQPAQQCLGAGTDGSRCDSIDASSSCPLVSSHPAPRDREKRRVVDEVVQVIETTGRIDHRPSVQLRLHCEYPRLGLNWTGPRSADVHQRPPRLASMLRAHWTPSPCARLSRARTTTGPPPHFAGIDRRQVFPAMTAGTSEVVPTFTLEPFNGVGAQLCPCNLATATPQSFTVASRPTT